MHTPGRKSGLVSRSLFMSQVTIVDGQNGDVNVRLPIRPSAGRR